MNSISISSDQFLKSLEGIKDTSAQSAQIAQWAREGSFAFLYEIARRLDASADARILEWARRSMVEDVLITLTLTPQPDALRYASLLAVAPLYLKRDAELIPGTRINGLLRDTASRIAANTPADLLEALFAEYRNEEKFTEYLAALLYEMVLRGKIRADDAPLANFQNHLQAQEHPLSRLPLRLLNVERGLPNYLPNYSPRSSSWAMPFGPSSSDELMEPIETVPEIGVRPEADTIVHEETSAEWSARSASAVKYWADSSNGVIEARAFSLRPTLFANQVGVPLLMSFGLDCLKEAVVSNVTLRTVPMNIVLNTLFSAAATGGAYNSGLGGAYGRLMAWESVAGLSGCPSNDIAVIDAHAQNCHWWEFQANTDWFYQVAWDIGIVALQPDGQSLTVLAATDTD